MNTIPKTIRQILADLDADREHTAEDAVSFLNEVICLYEDYEGLCVKNGMYYIDDHCFLFNDSGYMLTGWQKIEDDWYYFDENGYMAVGWKEINSIWYCFDEDGCMMTGAHCVDDCFYHFRSDGSWDGKYYSTYLECWEAQ